MDTPFTNLRNLLTPHYNLAAIVLTESSNQNVIDIMLKEAKLIQENKDKVLEIIKQLETNSFQESK